MPALNYILPIKSSCTDGDAELTAYLTWLSDVVDVIVVDGSPWHVFQARARCWRGIVAHVAPDPGLRYRNGKVNGVITGLRAATADKVIVADDDVRYDAEALARLDALLDRFDLIRPQNYFTPLPWHARWDTARSLLNRLTPAGDYPGTLALRRLPWLVDSGYDGDVLFENLELIRTVAAHGGVSAAARDLYVRRLPCSVRHFLRQRVRQAYDSQAQPARLVGELAVIPLALTALRHRQFAVIAAGTAAAIALAEVGRRRDHGDTVFPASASTMAPLWLLERGVCAWLALATRILLGGVRYSGARMKRAAHSCATLTRTAALRQR